MPSATPGPHDRSTPPHELHAVGGPVRRALTHEGITTWEEVDALTDRELLALHGVGPRGVRILRATPPAPAAR